MSRPSGRGWADRVDLSRPTKELARENGVTTSAVTLARRVRGVPNPTPKPKPPPRPPRAPKPTREPAATPTARPERSSPRQSANVTPPAAANDILPAIRQALADEMKGWGTSPGIAAMLIATRYRVAREVVEAIAEDVAGMRREVSNG